MNKLSGTVLDVIVNITTLVYVLELMVFERGVVRFLTAAVTPRFC